MARKKIINVTKAEIVRVATEQFLRKGYTCTTVKAISDMLGISTGHVTFYYPTKEHLLAVLVDMLCDFQWKLMEQSGAEGESQLKGICLELTAMAAMCEENEVAKDFYISAYTHAMTLEIIRRNDMERAKSVFSQYRPDWTEMQFAEAEVLVSGIEYATLMATADSPPLDVRIGGALYQIMSIYYVPEEMRSQLVEDVLRQDYRGIGRRILKEFIDYIDQVNEQTLDALLELAKTGKGNH